jgi:hypothetical protein
MIATPTSTALFVTAIIIWLAMMAGLVPVIIGWFIATTLFLLSMTVVWLPEQG